LPLDEGFKERSMREVKRIMKSYRKELWFETGQRREFINITPQIKKCLAEIGVKEGLLLCDALHITTSAFINDEFDGGRRKRVLVKIIGE
jgi:thiamine phosphate synthase YjbQ (UPF0047 family)